MVNDLHLVVSVYIAHLIVYRVIRQERSERALRLRRLRVVPNHTQSRVFKTTEPIAVAPGRSSQYGHGYKSHDDRAYCEDRPDATAIRFCDAASLKRTDSCQRRFDMQDLIYIAITIVFFLIALAYVRGCEKLQ
jgi:hypothetical protein